MALFTGKHDANLPLLTRIGQLDTANVDEVKLFLQREIDTAQFADISHEEYTRTILSWVAQGNDLHLDIVSVCDLAKKVMRDMAERGAIRWEDARKIQKSQPVRVLKHTITMPRDGYVPMENIRASWGSQQEMLSAMVFLELMNLVIRGVENAPSRVTGICVECDSPFVLDSMRAGRKFCSHRCGDRVSARKKRAAVKE